MKGHYCYGSFLLNKFMMAIDRIYEADLSFSDI